MSTRLLTGDYGFSFENVPDSGPQSTPINDGSDSKGDVDYWSGPNDRSSQAPPPLGPGNDVVGRRTPTTVHMPGPAG